MEGIWDWGIGVVQAVQGLGDWLTTPMKLLTFLGEVEFYLVILPLLFWCWDARLGIRAAAILFLSASLNDGLKLAFHAPRPYWLTQEVKALSSQQSFGVPSGHAQNGISVWGLLAASSRRGWVGVGVAALIFLIGLSRIYLGMHFPTDVLGGWLVGGLVLWLFLRVEDRVAAWLTTRTALQQAVVALAASLALLLPSLVALAALGDWQTPDEWVRNAVAQTGVAPAPLEVESTISVAGTVLGMGLGLIGLRRLGGIDSRGTLRSRTLRYTVGIVGMFILWAGLGAILPREDTLLSYVLRYLRYAVVGGWVTGLAPALFLRLGLVQQQPAGRE